MSSYLLHLPLGHKAMKGFLKRAGNGFGQDHIESLRGLTTNRCAAGTAAGRLPRS